MQWKWSTFDELTTDELYELLSLREEVFAIEQHSLYQDIDGADRQAIHLLGFSDDQLVAYLRLFPVGIVHPDAISFGRVVIKRLHRGKGLAHAMMAQLNQFVSKNNAPIKIMAQLYLQDFYASYQFEPTGEPFDHDGIAHIHMARKGVKM